MVPMEHQMCSWSSLKIQLYTTFRERDGTCLEPQNLGGVAFASLSLTARRDEVEKDPDPTTIHQRQTYEAHGPL